MDCESHDIINYITKLMKNEQFSEVIDFLKNPSNVEFLEWNGWDMVHPVFSKLKECTSQKSHLHTLEDILVLLAKKSNPKEILLNLIEEAYCCKGEKFFYVFLNPLKEALIRVPGKRGKTFEEVLEVLYAHVLTWPVPEDYNLEGDERLLLDLDPAVRKTFTILPKCIEFFEPFVDEVSLKNVTGENICYIDRVEHQRKLLVNFLLKLFHYPLLYHDLHCSPNRAKSTIRLCCENIVNLISCMCSNVFTLYSTLVTEESDINPMENNCFGKSIQGSHVVAKKDSVSHLAVANFSYVVIAEQLACDSHPYVYSNLFLFQKHLYFIVLLLSEKKFLAIYKGLSLANFFLDCIEEFEISWKYLELKNFILFPKILSYVAINCPIEEHRHLSIKLFQAYVAKYDWVGRYRLLLLIISSVEHSGVQGLAITLYKNNLHFSLSKKDNRGCCFYGRNMREFFRYAVRLRDSVETDLLEYSDKTMSALNLLRYLVLRDSRNQNITGIWDIIDEVKETFLEPLQKGLVLSKAHYELQKRLIKEAEASKTKSDALNCTTAVYGQVLPNIPDEHNLRIIESALLTFDMIESILMRVYEIL